MMKKGYRKLLLMLVIGICSLFPMAGYALEYQDGKTPELSELYPLSDIQKKSDFRLQGDVVTAIDQLKKEPSLSQGDQDKAALLSLMEIHERNVLDAFLTLHPFSPVMSIYQDQGQVEAAYDYLAMLRSIREDCEGLEKGYWEYAHLIDLQIHGDMAKALPQYDLYMSYPEEDKSGDFLITSGRIEGYIFVRTDEGWKIDNIFMDGGCSVITDNFKYLEEANSEDALSAFTFLQNNINACEYLNNYTDHAPRQAHEEEEAFQREQAAKAAALNNTAETGMTTSEYIKYWLNEHAPLLYESLSMAVFVL